MSESARKLVAVLLGNEDLINTLANASTTQGNVNVVNSTQYRSTDEELSSLFRRESPAVMNTSQPVMLPSYQASNVTDTQPPNQQQPPNVLSVPIYNLRPYTLQGPRQRR